MRSNYQYIRFDEINKIEAAIDKEVKKENQSQSKKFIQMMELLILV